MLSVSKEFALSQPIMLKINKKLKVSKKFENLGNNCFIRQIVTFNNLNN